MTKTELCVKCGKEKKEHPYFEGKDINNGFQMTLKCKKFSPQKKQEERCSLCGSEKTVKRKRNGKVTLKWNLLNGKRICRTCWQKNNSKYKLSWAKGKKKYDKNNPEKNRARQIARDNIKLEGLCEICKVNPTQHRHHPDYSKPLQVQLVCNKCHGEIHNGK